MRFGEREKWADCQGNCFSRFVGIGGGTGGDLRKGRDWVGAEFLKGRILAVAVLGDWQRNRVDDQIHGGKFSGYQIAMRPNLPSSFILLQKSFRKSAAAFESLPSPLRKGPFEKKTEAGQPSSRLAATRDALGQARPGGKSIILSPKFQTKRMIVGGMVLQIRHMWPI